jgi:hypothetical protein
MRLVLSCPLYTRTRRLNYPIVHLLTVKSVVFEPVQPSIRRATSGALGGYSLRSLWQVFVKLITHVLRTFHDWGMVAPRNRQSTWRSQRTEGTILNLKPLAIIFRFGFTSKLVLLEDSNVGIMHIQSKRIGNWSYKKFCFKINKTR